MPAALFRAAEILDMAIRIERQGINFYAACREAVPAGGLQQVFDDLIAQEKIHEKVFAKMKAEHGDHRLPEEYAGQYERHTAAFVRDRVFGGPGDAAGQVGRLEDARTGVDWAIDFEKKSIAFYEWMKDRVRASERSAIDDVIAQEYQHVERLEARRVDLPRDAQTGGQTT